MNFNMDDPDLLSDNSLDNSFFEPTASKAAGAARASKQSADGSTRPKINTSTPRSSMQPDDREDDDLGFDPKQPKAATKSNLLDDLLGAELSKKPSHAHSAKPTISRQSTTDDNTDNSFLRPKTSIGRRSSGNSAMANSDPLGLFSATAAKATNREQTGTSTSGRSTPRAKKRSSTAEWLGLRALDEHEEMHTPKTFTKTATTDVAMQPAAEVLTLTTPSEEHDNSVAVNQDELTSTSKHSDNMPITLLSNMQLESKNVIGALQAQEAQLAMATNIRQQETALQSMQRKQDMLLQQQERQFQDLLQQQLRRQQQMEEHIQQQQQRINNHIELLLSQPATVITTLQDEDAISNYTMRKEVPETKAASDTQNENVLKLVQMEADIKRLELEKLRLEELVEQLRSSNEREADLLQASHKKQMHLLQDHATAVEDRFKTELQQLQQHFEQKSESLQSEKAQIKTEFQTEIQTLKQDHEDEIRRLRRAQENDLEMLKEEHSAMIDRFRQSKLLEFAAVQQSGNYLQVLQDAHHSLDSVKVDLQDIRQHLSNEIETQHKEKELELQLRENKLADTERRLKLSEDAAHQEKQRLMALVGSLELQLSKLSSETNEDHWILKQNIASLEAAKAAFEKEKDYHREQAQRDEKRIAELKEQQLEEQKKLTLLMQEERTHLRTERAKLETERRLHKQTDLDGERAEVETAIRLAHEAKRQAETERERYYKLIQKTDANQLELLQKENTLRLKEDELSRELISYRKALQLTQEERQKMQIVAQQLQAKLKVNDKRLQEMLAKEQFISQERLALSQERVALQELKRRLSERKCELCKLKDQHDINNMLKMHSADAHGTGSNDNKTKTHLLVPPTTSATGGMNIVDRMLDENIQISLKTMQHNAGPADYWRRSMLDDDSKTFVLENSKIGLD